MTQRHAGTVTVLFTDVVGSTQQRRHLGDDETETVRRAHFRLLRDALAGHGGREVKTIGDSIMAEFASALDAALCAVAMQRAVHAQNATEDEARRQGLRVGMDAGEPAREDGDLFGTPVVVARRLCDSAAGGEIIVSDLVRALIGSRGSLEFRAKPPLQLKGFAEPIAAYDLAWSPEAAPAEQAATPAAPLPLPAALALERRTQFVGRADEVAALTQQWRDAAGGASRFVMLTGEPGIGKTRLCAELARTAHEGGASVLYGRCDEDALVAFQPFAEALHDLASSRRVPEAVWDLVAGIEPSRADEQRYRSAEGVAAVLRDLAAAGPVLLVLDDLQWAKPPTLPLVRHVARAGIAGLMIVACYREADVPREHPLAALLADLRREREVARTTVAGLTRDDVRRMVSAWAGEEASAELAAAVFEHTEGNPFFIEELLRHLSETGALRREDGRLTAGLRATRFAVPEGVKAVLARRLARLSEACNNVLTIASVIGRAFDIDSIQRASALATDEILAALEEAVAVGVVDEVPATGRYAFAHALVHEALSEELTSTRRIHLHGQTLRYADSSGTKLAYEVLGSSGPSIIAVGLANCPALRTRNRDVARHWDRIAAMGRLILYDKRGVGFSAAPERGYGMTASVADLLAVLDACDAGTAFLWGAVDGGPIALALAAQHPERVAGLILVSTTARMTATDGFPYGINTDTVASFLRTEALDRSQAASRMAGTRHGSADAEAIGEIVQRVPKHAWNKILAAYGAADARSVLDTLRTPALIVHDPENRYIPVEAAYYLHEHLPGSELEVTVECRPPTFGEKFYERIEAFVGEVAGSNAK